MARRYQQSSSGLSNLSSPSSTFYFASNYLSSRTYYTASPGVSSNRKLYTGSSGLSSAYSSSPIRSTFDLPRPKTFGVAPVYHSPARVVKPSMPALSEGAMYRSRPTPPPPAYRPLPSTPYFPSAARVRPDARNTANIDVAHVPRSRLDYQAQESPRKASKEDELGAATSKQRDTNVGTLRRGRKVIRLTTTRMPSPDKIASASREAQKATTPLERRVEPRQADQSFARTAPQDVSKLPPKPTNNVLDERARLPPKPYVPDRSPMGTPPDRVRKTPGEKLKEKYLIASRKGPKKPPSFGFQPQQATSPVPSAPLANFRSALSDAVSQAKGLKTSDRQDSGLGSSPAITAPTSLRDAKDPMEVQTSANQKEEDKSNWKLYLITSRVSGPLKKLPVLNWLMAF